jgi:streptomycin 6-kinase
MGQRRRRWLSRLRFVGELQRLEARHAEALLRFERENRAYFARSVPDRGDDYFTGFAERHAALLAEQATGRCRFHVLVDPGGAVLGRFNLVDLVDGEAHLGYRVAERVSGRGVATEGVGRILRMAQQEYGLRRLIADAALDNPSSRNVLRRHGFVPVGEVLLSGRPGLRHVRDLAAARPWPPGETLTRNAAGVWGDQGRQWLAALPGLIDEIAAQWELTVERTHPMTFHWVARVVRADGTPAVLKIGVVDGHLDAEAEVLRIFAGRGAVRLLAEDRERGALLISSAEPGTPAAELVPADDTAATAALIEVGRRLHRVPPPGCTLPHLRDHGGSFRKYLAQDAEPIPRALVERAARLFDELCATAPHERVLHGDLHHGNVLRHGPHGWLAIDPVALIGDPGYDCAAMLYNPDPDRREPALLRLVPARIEQLAAGFGLPVERVRAWGFVMGVLSELWTLEATGAARTRALDVAVLLSAQANAR